MLSIWALKTYCNSHIWRQKKNTPDCVVCLHVTVLHVQMRTWTEMWQRDTEKRRWYHTPSVLIESEPCWGALGLKSKRALTWHILVSNCCLLSLINNGAEFELVQIRAVNLHTHYLFLSWLLELCLVFCGSSVFQTLSLHHILCIFHYWSYYIKILSLG